LETSRVGGGGRVNREYTVIYEWTGKNYSAYVPDLPGCVAAGDTLEETEQLIREAIQLYIEALSEQGDPVPEPTVKAGTVVISA
jgi:predicted RNase H-like HicB family nuclease